MHALAHYKWRAGRGNTVRRDILSLLKYEKLHVLEAGHCSSLHQGYRYRGAGGLEHPHFL